MRDAATGGRVIQHAAVMSDPAMSFLIGILILVVLELFYVPAMVEDDACGLLVVGHVADQLLRGDALLRQLLCLRPPQKHIGDLRVHGVRCHRCVQVKLSQVMSPVTAYQAATSGAPHEVVMEHLRSYKTMTIMRLKIDVQS